MTEYSDLHERASTAYDREDRHSFGISAVIDLVKSEPIKVWVVERIPDHEVGGVEGVALTLEGAKELARNQLGSPDSSITWSKTSDDYWYGVPDGRPTWDHIGVSLHEVKPDGA